jgi:hypothetical protein
VGRRRGWWLAVLALLFFAGLAVAPLLYQGGASPPWVASAQRATLAPLPTVAAIPPAVRLSSVAQPMRPSDPPAALPTGDAIRLAALVASEDLRLRTLLRHSSRLTVPVVVPVRGGVPTLVLPGRPGGYTLTDLTNAGAAVPARQGGGYLLVDSVLVTTGATLKLGGPSLPRLLMDSSPSGFTSIVAWGGSLALAGDSSQAPLTITGWDHVANQPAQNKGNGRPYIRAVGGQLDLKNVRASALGFWSGRTGGVAWTGVSSRPSSGGATSSTFVGNTYGAFVARGDKVQFTDDLFEGNELDGLRLHRNAMSSVVTGSASARNGGNGFVVSRGAIGDVLRGDLAVHNQGNGFLLNGQALVNGASPSGGTTGASTGTLVEASQAEANGRTGILVDGGAGTLVRDNIICGPITGIAVRAGADNTSVVGNQVRCGGRVALSIGPAVTGTTVAGNTLSGARIGLLVRNAPGVRIIRNGITDMSLFAISVRGASPGVVGDDNVISGRGFNPIDVRGGAPSPLITTSNLSGWQRRSQVTVLGYLRYHPILTTWLVILLLVALCALVVRHRLRPARPYRYTMPWRPAETAVAATARPEPATNGRRHSAPRPMWTEPAISSIVRANNQ